jgi:hypothetical protein
LGQEDHPASSGIVQEQDCGSLRWRGDGTELESKVCVGEVPRR